jgi:large subunit ribosomal protein L25
MLEIKASKRDKTGTYATKKIMSQGFLPAAIQNGQEAPFHIKVDKGELEKIYATGFIFSQLLKINLDGSVVEAVVKKIEQHPVNDNIIHIDFINYTASDKIKILLKIEFINKDKSIGLKKGGFLNVKKRNIAVIVDKNSIVDKIFKIDITNLVVGEKLRLSDLVTPENIKILFQKDDLVASITGRGIKSEITEEESSSENP